jgi:hypothetical protein
VTLEFRLFAPLHFAHLNFLFCNWTNAYILSGQVLPEASMLQCTQPIRRLLTTMIFEINGVLQRQRACGRSYKGRSEKADESVLLWLRPGVFSRPTLVFQAGARTFFLSAMELDRLMICRANCPHKELPSTNSSLSSIRRKVLKSTHHIKGKLFSWGALINELSQTLISLPNEAHFFFRLAFN